MKVKITAGLAALASLLLLRIAKSEFLAQSFPDQ